jgi:hypothetical protein
VAVPDDIRRFAEEPDGRIPEPPSPARRIVTPSFVLVLSPVPAQSSVSTIRTTEAELDGVVAEVRRIARAEGYTRTVWFVGPSCRPVGLADMLVARGFVPADQPPFEAEFTAMALVHPPPPPRHSVDARMVHTLDEYTEGVRIIMEAFGEPPSVAKEWLTAAPRMWAANDGVRNLSHLAFLDGKPVGFALTLAGTNGFLLGGSGVLPAARGRGAYRAMLAARWQRAVELGQHALVIQAGAMSRPILERCGFETVCTLTVLDDPTVAKPPR